MLLEWEPNIAVVAGGDHIDFNIEAVAALGLLHRMRLRLYVRPVSEEDLDALIAEARAETVQPTAICLGGLQAGVNVPSGCGSIDRANWKALLEQSGLIEFDGARQPSIDRGAMRAIRDQSDVRLALMSGFLWLRPLSRDRVPPSLRWTRRPAHELFERCFFMTMTTTFRGDGESWGTRKRGRPIPDGVLRLPKSNLPILYDCKASADGYVMSMEDVRGFADYLRRPIKGSWKPKTQIPGFLVVSAEIGSKGKRSWADRQKDLQDRVRGARLYWVRANHLVEFAMALERAGVTTEHREMIDWPSILKPGDVMWDSFDRQMTLLEQFGYRFEP
jgi:hypothetical protein